jgi:hypothetical protein
MIITLHPHPIRIPEARLNKTRVTINIPKAQPTALYITVANRDYRIIIVPYFIGAVPEDTAC